MPYFMKAPGFLVKGLGIQLVPVSIIFDNYVGFGVGYNKFIGIVSPFHGFRAPTALGSNQEPVGQLSEIS
jgi:hypothetical protein